MRTVVLGTTFKIREQPTWLLPYFYVRRLIIFRAGSFFRLMAGGGLSLLNKGQDFFQLFRNGNALRAQGRAGPALDAAGGLLLLCQLLNAAL